MYFGPVPSRDTTNNISNNIVWINPHTWHSSPGLIKYLFPTRNIYKYSYHIRNLDMVGEFIETWTSGDATFTPQGGLYPPLPTKQESSIGHGSAPIAPESLVVTVKMLLDEALNARGFSTTNTTTRPLSLNALMDQDNNIRTSHQNLANPNRRYDPSRAAGVNARQLSFADETEDNCDKEYEAERTHTKTTDYTPDMLSQTSWKNRRN